MKTIIAILVVVSVGISVDAIPFFEHEYVRTPHGNFVDKASLQLLKEAYNAGDDKNVIASPLGVLMLLSLYSTGAGHDIQWEITNALGRTDYRQVSKDYVNLAEEFEKMDRNFLTVANKIYVKNAYELNQTFASTARDYKSSVESINFEDPAGAASIINKWAEDMTKGHIKSPLSADAITPDTVAGLFNVIFFQGHWHVPFDAKNTKDEDFHVDKKTTVKKPTMHLEQSLYYTESEELGARMVELPYKENGFRMIVVLPNEIDGLSSVIEKASERGLLEDVFKMVPTGRDVDLHMPKFEIRTKHNLNDLLPKFGVSKIFTEGHTGIVKDSTVVVSKAFQEAFVKVDEEGATAGAFTGMLAVPMSFPAPPPPEPLVFKVDHPFLFVIMQKDKILFAGTYAK